MPFMVRQSFDRLRTGFTTNGAQGERIENKEGGASRSEKHHLPFYLSYLAPYFH